MKCYLCDCTSFKRREGNVRDNPKLKILQCDNCGLVTLDDHSHITVKHYEESGMHGDGKLPTIETMLLTSSENDERRYQQLKELIANKRVLDFGCGNGGFLKKAKTIAASVTGVEPEKRAREYNKDRFKVFQTIDVVDGDYDIITAFHVIEHLLDPIDILKKMKNLVAQNGVLIIEVPSSDDALLTLYWQFRSDSYTDSGLVRTAFRFSSYTVPFCIRTK